jgi:hypothetical protein
MSTGKRRTSTSKSPARSRQKRAARAGSFEQGAGLGDWFFGASEEASARVAEIRQRWAKLQAWGVRDKLPFTRAQQASVAEFLASWDRDQDVSNVGAVTSDLVVMERHAEDRDRTYGGSFLAHPIATTFDPDASSRAREASTVADKAAREATAVVKDAATDLGEAARPLLNEAGSPLPLLLGLGVVVAAVGCVVAIKSVPRVPRYLF